MRTSDVVATHFVFSSGALELAGIVSVQTSIGVLLTRRSEKTILLAPALMRGSEIAAGAQNRCVEAPEPMSIAQVLDC